MRVTSYVQESRSDKIKLQQRESKDFFLPLHKLATFKVQLSYTVLLTLIYNTPPWPILCHVYASLNHPPSKKTQWEKKGRRKEYISYIAYAAPVASLKTLHEKTQWKKTHQEKKSTIVDIGSVLQDRHVIFGITIMGLGFWGWSPPEPCNSLSRIMPIPQTHLWKLEVGRHFVNKSARFSHDLASRIFISPLFWSSWG